MPRNVLCGTAVLCVLAACGSSGSKGSGGGGPAATFGAPTLLWSRGGCADTWCELGWYGSPALADLDGDGAAEVIWGSFGVSALRAADGHVVWTGVGAGRVFGGVAVLPGPAPRIVAGRSDGTLTIYAPDGAPFVLSPFGTSDELRSLAVAPLDGGEPRIVVGRAAATSTSLLTAMDTAGNVLGAGWPAPASGTPGYTWGLYGENLAIAPLGAGGENRILAGTDVHYLLGLDAAGSPLAATAFGADVAWSQIPAYVDPALEAAGYGECETSPRASFAASAPSVADLDGDGTLEIVVVGDAYRCDPGDYVSVAHVPFVLSADRGRWKKGAFDWTTPPVPANGAPLAQDYEVIDEALPNPVLADLDGDGRREILYASYDGRLHAFWLDRTEHGSWPYAVAGDGIRFASEPAVVDLDGDGKAEVLFTSWPEKTGTKVGKLHVLDHLGRPIHELDLPPSFPAGSWNGALGAPTVANVDADPDLEVLVGTARAGVVAYRIPNTPRARVLWGTGRGNFQRTGTQAVP
jgi:hypothetical protein